jgi:hypothetical protein
MQSRINKKEVKKLGGEIIEEKFTSGKFLMLVD